MLTRFGAWNQLPLGGPGWNHRNWRFDAMTQKPTFGDFAWSDDLVDAIVIKIRMLRDAEANIAARKRGHVVGVSIVKGVIG